MTSPSEVREDWPNTFDPHSVEGAENLDEIRAVICERIAEVKEAARALPDGEGWWNLTESNGSSWDTSSRT